MTASGIFGFGPQFPFGASAAVFFIAAVYFRLGNASDRKAIQGALNQGRTRHGRRLVKMPEQLASGYDAPYLERFILAAQAATTADNRNALDLYRAPAFLWNDVRFALALGAFLVLGNFAIAPFAPLRPYGEWLAYVCAAMGAAYATFDILEDLALHRIFRHGPNVDPLLAAGASLSTLVKFTTLYFALPAGVGLGVKFAHDNAYDVFYGGLKVWPLVILLAACLWPWLARVLWACRISLLSALAGYFLFLFVIQAQDLFADTTYGSQPLWHVGYWTGVFAAVAVIWALPVHYAARDALEGARSAWYVRIGASAALVRWTPRILGVVPVVAVLLGILGAAVETRYAASLDPGLDRQYVLLAMGGWFTMGFVVLVMLERRRFVTRYLHGAGSAQSLKVVHICAAATGLAFVVLVLFPLHTTQYIARAALVPFLLGSGVLLFGLISRFADSVRIPVVALIVAGVAILTAANARFNDVRKLTITNEAQQLPHQLSLPDAVGSWRTANHCEANVRACPPAMIVAADGGASRAAYFTATVLGNILDQLSTPGEPKCGDANNPSRCIFAMSGVSGGSLGLAVVKAALLDADVGPPCRDSVSRDSGKWQGCLQRLVAGDFLSPVFVGLAFRDQVAPPIYPFNDPEKWGDRAVLLEKSWERNYLAQLKPSLPAKGRESEAKAVGLSRPFTEPRADGRWTPLLLLNGTSVQTGRRVIASELEPIWKVRPADGTEAPQALHQWAYDLFDIFDASCGAPEDKAGTNCASDAPADYRAPVNVRLSTAALLSARFPIISPAGVIRMRGEGNVHGDEVVDGGYFENSGLTTALDLAAALHAFELSPIVLSISNDPTTEAVEAVKRGPRVSKVPSAIAANSLDLEVRAAAENSIWIKAIDLLYAPFAALLRTRDSHAEEAGRVLTQQLQGWDVPAFVGGKSSDIVDAYATFFPIRVYAQGDGFAMPDLSMSWWLSPVTRKALNHQLNHPENKKQMRLLLCRLSRVGCSGCMNPGDASGPQGALMTPCPP